MNTRLHRFHGGMQLEDHKTESLARGLQQASLPGQLFLPLNQHIGEVNAPLVKPGERVLRGQLIAASSSPISAPLHAPTSGTIREISAHPVPHPSGQSDACIVIDVDGKDQAIVTDSINPDKLTVPELIPQIRQAGIVGLGGASFPTAAKLARANDSGIDNLIINGVECEPYITCDDILMQTHAQALVKGIDYISMSS